MHGVLQLHLNAGRDTCNAFHLARCCSHPVKDDIFQALSETIQLPLHTKKKSRCLFCLMLFQVQRELNLFLFCFTLAKAQRNILGTFTVRQRVNMFLFQSVWHRPLCQNRKRNVLKFQNLSKEKIKYKKKKEKNLETLQPHLYLVNKASPFHAVCLRPDVFFCVYVHVCVWATLCLWFTVPPTPPPLLFCLLVNCHGEGGYNSRLRSAINLDTSYLCLPLQGEACPVTNMINPLPLSWQPPAHTPLTSILSSLISRRNRGLPRTSWVLRFNLTDAGCEQIKMELDDFEQNQTKQKSPCIDTPICNDKSFRKAFRKRQKKSCSGWVRR